MSRPRGQPFDSDSNGSPSSNSRPVLILAIVAIILILVTGAVAGYMILDRSDANADTGVPSTTTVTGAAGVTELERCGRVTVLKHSVAVKELSATHRLRQQAEEL